MKIQPDEMFVKVVQKLQRDRLLNSRRKLRFEYAGDEETMERFTAEQLGVDSKDVLYEFESYASSIVSGPMLRYISKPPPSAVTFSAGLFKVYFPIGRSGTAEAILETAYLKPDDKVTEKNKRKIENIMNELREEKKQSSQS
jgi:hypothetical protein